jgi:hypothetical protein
VDDAVRGDGGGTGPRREEEGAQVCDAWSEKRK